MVSKYADAEFGGDEHDGHMERPFDLTDLEVETAVYDNEDHYIGLLESAQRIDRKVYPAERVDHQRWIANLRGNHSVDRRDILRRHAGL